MIVGLNVPGVTATKDIFKNNKGQPRIVDTTLNYTKSTTGFCLEFKCNARKTLRVNSSHSTTLEQVNARLLV